MFASDSDPFRSRFVPFGYAGLVSLLLAGCTMGGNAYVNSQAGAEATATGTIGSDEAFHMITSLEQFPFSEDADAQRTVLTAWTVSSPDIGPFALDDVYIHPLQEGNYLYGPELFMQYMFGVARGYAENGGAASEDEAVESGLRSMLAAYKSMLRADGDLHDPFLDGLDRIRREGGLHDYIVDMKRNR